MTTENEIIKTYNHCIELAKQRILEYNGGSEMYYFWIGYLECLKRMRGIVFNIGAMREDLDWLENAGACSSTVRAGDS